MVDDVRRTQAALARQLTVPAWYDEGLAVAVTALVVGVSTTLNGRTPGGLLLFLGAASMMGWQVRRFREHNGMWVSGLRGGATVASTVAAAVAIIAAMAGATAAGQRGWWWLAVVIAVAGAAVYWLASKRWMVRYRRETGAS